MKTKDIILSVGGQEVNSTSELQAKIATYKPGDSVKMNILRGTIQKEITIVME